MSKLKSVWYCRECGNKQLKWTGTCGTCNQWNTLDEEVELSEKQRRFESRSTERAKPVRVLDVSEGSLIRYTSGLQEVDRLLGGGLVSGSLTLLAGDPGIGKSTLMLQIAQGFADRGMTVLYVCGEESLEQTSLRAKRLGITSQNLYLLHETLFSHIKAQVDALQPKILIVDSIQILYKHEIPSAPGSVSQVREIAAEFMHLSKGLGISTFLIGHVTKSGEIAGPRVLEHLVDTVLDFEGDRQHGYRLLRATKNRFGPTDDVAVFQMGLQGLREVTNPSQLFLEERKRESAGSVIIPTLEGSRPILVEAQALVASSSFSTSTRKSAGLDQNRLSLLLALLEKRMGYPLHRCDVFVSIAGGMKIVEPGIDLGVLLAISSSFCARSIDPDTVVLGEVGLGGEVRSVPRIEARIKEALHMGFRKCILPQRNLKGLQKEAFGQIELKGIEYVDEAVQGLLR